MNGENVLIEQIKNNTDILDLIGEKVRLRKTGETYAGLCPFHSEKTPSFHVFPKTQSYYCFGCHAGGNIFSFIMQTEDLNFKEAVKYLASRAGINYEEKNYNGKKNLYEIMNMAAEYFHKNLNSDYGSTARAYIQRRNLNSHDIENFNLGYSLISWSAISEYFKKYKVSQRELLECGLLVENKNYDRFRGRLMFPIKDISGRVIAFGGRILDGDGAKYINSPESKIYSKRNNLYLLYEAKNFMRKKSRSILVEGYMDALRLHKCGFPESVASLGTSLTPEQADLLARFSNTCYVCYDSDQAGKEATIRAMYILHDAGLNVRVVNLPDKKDPDEFLNSNPPESFEAALNTAKPLILMQVERVKPLLKNSDTRRQAVKDLFEGLRKFEESEVMEYQSLICTTLGISTLELKKQLHNSNSEIKLKVVATENIFSSDDSEILEAGLCAMLWKEPERVKKINIGKLIALLKTEIAREIILGLATEAPEILKMRWQELGENAQSEFIAKGEIFCQQVKESHGEITSDERWNKIYTDFKNYSANSRVAPKKINFLVSRADNFSESELKKLKNLRDLHK